MAYPSLVGTAQGASAAVNSTSHSVNIPTGNVDDLILVVLSLSAATSATKPTGYKMLANFDSTTVAATHVAMWKIATTTSESLTVTSAASCQSTHIVYRFSNAKWVTSSCTSSTTATTAVPQQIGKGATRGSVETYFVCATTIPSNLTPSAMPASFANLISQAPSGTSPATHTCDRQALGISIASGTWTFGTATTSINGTYAVEPEEPVSRAYEVGYQSDGYTTNSNHTTSFRYLRQGAGIEAQANDLVIACFQVSAIGAGQRNVTISTAGYTQVSNQYQVGANFSLSQYVYYKVLTGADTSIQWTTDTVATESARVQYVIFRPPNGTERFTVTYANGTSSNSSILPDPPAVTVPAAPSQQVLYFGGQAANGAGGGTAGFTFNGADYWYWSWGGSTTSATGTYVSGDLQHVRFNGNSSILNPQAWTGGASNTTGIAMITTAILVSTSGGEFKSFDGTSWNPHAVKYYTGSNGWYTKPLLVWNGTRWLRANT